MSIILFGPPGVGKGTQSQLTCDHYGMAHISTGNILREEISKRSDLGRRVEGILKSGRLVSDDVVNEVVKGRIGALFPEVTEFLFDGYPRTVQQARSLDRALGDFGLGILCVVNLVAPRDELLKRLTGRRTCKRCGATFHIYFKASKVPDVCDVCGGPLVQRADDNMESVSKRLDEFARATAPLLEYYAAAGVRHDVDGTGQIFVVQERIRQVFDGIRRTSL